MRDPDVIAAMADASLRNGASGVRLESPEHIGAVRQRCPTALIVGLWKRSYSDSSVYITPGWEEMRAVWAAGADVVAIDATERYRPGGENLEGLIARAQRELGAELMADVDSVANGLRAAELGRHHPLWLHGVNFRPEATSLGSIAPAAAAIARRGEPDLRGRHIKPPAGPPSARPRR